MRRAGEYRSNLSGEMMYKSFVPSSLPPFPALELDDQILNALIKANIALTKLEMVSTKLNNVPMFVAMYVRKEALLSSQIEGTQATLDDILDPHLAGNTNHNISEVINYIQAMDYAVDRLNSLPLCNRLFLETHAVLMSNVRGSEKQPGEFRKSQNWIGHQGCTLKNARYVPPNVADMLEAMHDLQKYINADDSMDPLIRIALIHYQFETIHPFLDGNGRIGRLMVNLYLMVNKILSYPTLYISYFFKRNRIEYYDRLSEVRDKDNYEQWVLFFLRGLTESAEDAVESIEQMTELYQRNLIKISQFKSSSTKFIVRLFDYLQQAPIIDVQQTALSLGVSFNTVASAISKLESINILKKLGNAKRGRIFIYEEYLQLLRKDT